MSIQGSLVQLEMEPMRNSEAVYGTEEPGAALKQQVAERLAAHRARRGGVSAAPNGPVAVPRQGRGRAAEIAAAVAERYANSVSYRAFLAAEAEEAIRRAEAAAEVAAVTAKAVAAAQYNLLAELDEMNAGADGVAVERSADEQHEVQQVVPFEREAERPSTLPVNEVLADARRTAEADRYGVRLHEEVALGRRPERVAMNTAAAFEIIDEDEVRAMEDEIAFRHAPVFEEMTRVEIAANLIEFPRQLIAARKARPRLAEGPLREESVSHPGQLRIFEVQPEQISSDPAMTEVSPGWGSIVLGAQPEPQPFQEEAASRAIASSPRIERARLSLRVMAAGVDACLVVAAALMFIAAGVKTAGGVPELFVSAKGAAAAMAIVVVLLWGIYEVLCLTLSNATAGMRYARIGLCTFADESPTRRQRVGRLLALAASICPFGLGLLWVWVDADGLAGHDRISGMYLRGY